MTRKKMDVFYCDDMVADQLGESPSPSAGKPRHVVEDWLRLKLPIEVIEPRAVTVSELVAVHDRAHVLGILNSRRSNGFGNTSMQIARSLPLTSGAMLSAARSAICGRTIACAPVSGFHHASYDQSNGFCTFNGLIVTAMALKRDIPDIQVGILDLDMHYGDGTDELIKRHGLRWIDHFTAGKAYRRPSQVAGFLQRLRRRLNDMVKCDVILYQAGADPHIDDPLGGFMTTEQMRERDQTVFAMLRGRPVAWNLAGGYQAMNVLLQLHSNTAREAIKCL